MKRVPTELDQQVAKQTEHLCRVQNAMIDLSKLRQKRAKHMKKYGVSFGQSIDDQMNNASHLESYRPNSRATSRYTKV